MSLVRIEKLDVKVAGYAVGTAAALTDPKLTTVAQDYKRHTASRMIPLEEDAAARRLASGEYHVSLKIDGEFCVLAYADGQAVTVNPGGTVRVGLACLTEAAMKLKAAGINKATIAGELHYLRPDGKRSRVHDISRIARQPASKAEVDGLQFAPFDIIEIDGVRPESTFKETWTKLGTLFAGSSRVALPESHWVEDGAGVLKHFRAWVDGGTEGAVVRSDRAGSFKLKLRHTLDAVVIGFTEGIDDRHGMIHDLLVAVMRPEGLLHVIGHVGGGFTEAERRAFYAELKDDVTASEYVEVNDQVAYHMVRPEIVVELSVLDLIAQSTRGTPMNKMVLHWDAPAATYRLVRRLPSVAMISPQFVRRREDKKPDADGIRMKQLTDLVDIPAADRDARQVSVGTSRILRRECWTKVLKGAGMIRKFVMWETNKQAEAEEFPAFVIHFTDFSPGRKTPLEREIRVSNSRDQIDALWTELIAENITKGWNPAGEANAPPPTAVAVDAPAKPPPKKRVIPKKKES